ncbi:hypothetical protein EVAR_94653_1 [Eumeta japonica]|uniref:Uncharacterized protein n=1 Tax=Eumeta variegata TaxID=151549 RepID=A0A4C1UTK2_EUMVA|nr:hypothetical protein EVAR_94653_1 [Eumeta japonica]
MRTTREQVITVPHGHLQPTKSHRCFAGLSEKIGHLMEERVSRWRCTLLKHKPKRNCCDTKRRHSLGFLTEYRDSGEGIILYCTCSCQRHKSE